jgi:long-chain acyl-CoA synthetase
MEAAIMRDPLFEQVMLLGEGKPYLSVVAVVSAEHWKKLCAESGLDAAAPATASSRQARELVLKRLSQQLKEFPGYAQVRRITLAAEPWTIENGMLTPTMKLKRAKVMERFNAEIDQMYAGH